MIDWLTGYSSSDMILEYICIYYIILYDMFLFNLYLV